MELRLTVGNKAEAAVDRNGKQGRIYRKRPWGGDLKKVLPEQAADTLPMKLGPHEQVVEVLAIPERNIATQIAAALRNQMDVIRGSEAFRDGWRLKAR
ncbi:hypothetical protein GCM10027159_06910 [Lysobacter terrae]